MVYLFQPVRHCRKIIACLDDFIFVRPTRSIVPICKDRFGPGSRAIGQWEPMQQWGYGDAFGNHVL